MATPNANCEIDWNSSGNHVLLNPRFPESQASLLLSLLQEFWSREKCTRSLFLLSSGTTASSISDFKWVVLSKSAFLASAASVNAWIKSDCSDIWLNVLPDFHVGGLSVWARSYLSGAKVIRFQPPKWNAAAFVNEVAFHRATLCSLVPAQVFDLVAENLKAPSSLRAIFVGGGALSPSLYHQAHLLGWPLLPSYGMTETCSQIATAELEGKAEGNLPPMHVLPHLDARVGEGGRLEFSGTSLFSGYVYWNDGQAIFEDPKREGWFLSSDRGVLEGRKIRLLGRITEMVKIGGESVELGRLRQILDEIKVELRLTEDLALIPVPNERLGHVIHLISARDLSPARAEATIVAFNSRVLAFEKIRKWHCLDEIPRTALGKLKEDVLKIIGLKA